MNRYGLSPSNDPRWERIAKEAIAQAEHEDVDIREFYRGLVAILNEFDDRLAASVDELREKDERQKELFDDDEHD